jgi:hypothetical protein
MMRRLPSDPEVWKRLAGRFAIDVYVSLTMTSINKGFSLSPEVMRYLGEREIEVGFDIVYDEEREAEPDTPANTAPPGRFA